MSLRGVYDKVIHIRLQLYPMSFCQFVFIGLNHIVSSVNKLNILLAIFSIESSVLFHGYPGTSFYLPEAILQAPKIDSKAFVYFKTTTYMI